MSRRAPAIPGQVPSRTQSPAQLEAAMSEPVPLRDAVQAFWAERNTMIVGTDPAPDPEPKA